MYVNDDRDDVAFLTGSGSSESGPVYSKRDLYERGHVAVCSHRQATCITVFVFSSIFLSSLVIAFARPWNSECGIADIVDTVDDHTETSKVLTATNGELFPWDDVRLPIFIRPVNYDLELRPNLTTLNVYGIVKFVFKVTEETNFIVFHMNGINITSKKINEKLKIQRILELPDRDQVYLETDKSMTPGTSFSVRLKFEYQLSKSLEGFYLSTYKDQNGIEKPLATTHFEPTYARRAFPCFDEPQLKAEFTVTITHHKDHSVFFNMPLKTQTVVKGYVNMADSGSIKDIPQWFYQRFNTPKQIPFDSPNSSRTDFYSSEAPNNLVAEEPGLENRHLLRDEFAATKAMSTYLLAFVICDFRKVTKVTPTNNISVSVIAAPGKIDQTNFALEAAVNLTDYYEQYFGVNYPLPKQDLIAIPDFGAGAMENWGLITYRETSLLFSPDKSSSKSQQWVGIVVAHELAHQWFGNLVTMRWWNDLWLNEGFASWMEYKGVAHIRPDWDMMEQFWSSKLYPALHLDSLSTSHPVSVPVRDPKEIEAIFDTISYKKGSSIIHMLERYIGEDDLRAGLTSYLNKYKYRNAVTMDLWKSLTKANKMGVNVEEMMNTWTLQMGYPLITISRLEGGVWCIKQTRFMSSALIETSQPRLPPSPYNYTWVVPVSFKTDSGDMHKVLLNATSNSSNAQVSLGSSVKWLKANINGSGYYRVQYPEDVWRSLSSQLAEDHTFISAVDRAQLIDDAFALLEAGQLDESIPLDLVSYLRHERSLVPWQVALSHLSSLSDLFMETETRGKLNKFIVELLEPVYRDLGWQDNGSHVERLLREHIIKAAIEAEHSEAVKEARDLFVKLKHNGDQAGVAANLRSLVYSVGVREGGSEEWEWCYQRFLETNIPSDRAILLSAMGDSKDIITLQKYLTMTLNQSLIRGQDVHTVLHSVSSNPSGSLLAWRHLQRHWEAIWSTFHSGSFTMGSIIKSVVGHFSTQFDYSQVKNFFQDKDVGAGELALRQTLEKIQIHIEFRKHYEQKISEWLDKQILKD